MDNLATKLNINSHEGWYNVTSTVVKHNGGAVLLDKYKGSLTKLLQNVYPEYVHILLRV